MLTSFKFINSCLFSRQAVQDLAQSVQPFAYLSFHTYGEYWLEPYGDGTPVDNVSLEL